MIGEFALKHINNFSEAQLRAYEKLLEMDDAILYETIGNGVCTGYRQAAKHGYEEVINMVIDFNRGKYGA